MAGESGTLDVFPNMALAWEISTDGPPVLVSRPTDLGSLAGTASAAHGVNFHADLVGDSDAWPFLKVNGAAMQPLPGLKKATHGYAADINDDGIVVGSQGWLFRGMPVFKAVLWEDPGMVVDLNKKVDLSNSGTLESAFRISNSGAILGSGYFPDLSESGDVGVLLIPAQ